MSIGGPKIAGTKPESRPAVQPPFCWRERDALLWIEADLPSARATFSTRCGGTSTGAYRSLNLGILTDDDPASVARNRRVLATALERDQGSFAMGLQVHGAAVERRLELPRRSAYAERGVRLANADAQVTCEPRVTPLVLVADCVPLVLGLPGAVAVAHCGWRGIAAGVVGNALAAACELAEEAPDRASAALGPGIGPCCYEVGSDVIERFKACSYDRALVHGNRLDLAEAIRYELERSGLAPDSIWHAALCTSCHSELFFSHRRDGGVTGRQAGVAWLNV